MLSRKWKFLYAITFIPLGLFLLFILFGKGVVIYLWRAMAPRRRITSPIRLLILAYLHEDNASARHRVYKYLPYLRQAGFVCTVLPPTGPETHKQLFATWRPGDQYRYFLIVFWRRFQALWSASAYDLVLVQRALLSEFFYDPPSFIFALKLLNPNLVFDLDDTIFMFPPQSVRSKSALLNGLAAWRFRAYAACSRLVVASTPYLAEAVRPYCRHVVVIPTPVDVENYPLRQHQGVSPLTIGWTGGPGNLAFLKIIEAPLARLARRYQLRFCLVSSRTIALDGIEVEFIPWTREIASTNMAMFDIGVMPLEDNAYTIGKCGFKLMQYMASGVPAVASPVGVNKTIVRHGETGYLAATAEEWEKYLETMIVDLARRREMGAACRLVAEKHFSYSAWAPQLIMALKSLIDERCDSPSDSNER